MTIAAKESLQGLKVAKTNFLGQTAQKTRKTEKYSSLKDLLQKISHTDIRFFTLSLVLYSFSRTFVFWGSWPCSGSSLLRTSSGAVLAAEESLSSFGNRELTRIEAECSPLEPLSESLFDTVSWLRIKSMNGLKEVRVILSLLILRLFVPLPAGPS